MGETAEGQGAPQGDHEVLNKRMDGILEETIGERVETGIKGAQGDLEEIGLEGDQGDHCLAG